MTGPIGEDEDAEVLLNFGFLYHAMGRKLLFVMPFLIIIFFMSR